MTELADYKLLFFDMDGTILNSHEVSLGAIQDAFRDVYAAHGIGQGLPEADLILAQIGKPDQTFFMKLMPEELYHLQPEIRDRSTDYEVRAYREGRGGLFEGASETLAELKRRGYTLVLVSNCGKKYFDSVADAFRLDDYYQWRICIGETAFVEKPDLVRQVYEKYDKRPFVMVGDRKYDLLSAERLGMPSVACLYGYGSSEELASGTKKINDIKGLLNIFTG